MTELLAPAGDIEAGYAALAYGADAVYLGLQSFSARAEATNFTPESLKVFTAYAHSLNKKVLVAVNTVFFDEELPALIDTLAAVEDAHADGVIVQDLGTARFATVTAACACFRRFTPDDRRTAANASIRVGKPSASTAKRSTFFP